MHPAAESTLCAKGHVTDEGKCCAHSPLCRPAVTPPASRRKALSIPQMIPRLPPKMERAHFWSSIRHFAHMGTSINPHLLVLDFA